MNYTFKHSADIKGNVMTAVYINGQYEATLFAKQKFPNSRAQSNLEKYAKQYIKPLAA